MKYFLHAMLLVVFCLGVNGQAEQRLKALKPAPRPLLKNIGGVQRFEETNTNVKEPLGIVTLADAVSAALQANPALAIYSQEIRAREAEALQASFRPNPEMGAEIENFAGSGQFNSFQGSEFTISVGQLVELGGKRQKRTQVAVLEADLAAWDYEAAKLNVFADVVKSFTNVLNVQQRIKLQEELVKVAEAFLQDIQRRVKAGKVSPAEAARAQVELSTTKINMEKLQQEWLSARKKLAATWGSTQPRFEQVEGALDTVFTVPSLDKLQLFIGQNPEMAAWAVLVQQRDAEIALEKARRIPNPIIAGGYRRLSESSDNAFVVGLSLPLFLFDRNQGNIQAAEYRRIQAERQKRNAEIALNTRLAEIHGLMSASFHEITTLKTDVIPEAQKAYDMVNQGYVMGKFAFLDVLDAQRTLFQVRSRHLNALREYYQSLADMERLIGQKISYVR